MYDIHQVSRYIGLSLLSKQMTVSPLKLQKLLYYAQSWSMVFFGRERQLFADEPQAWVNGPVYPVIYNVWKEHNMCEHLQPGDFGVLPENVDKELEYVSKMMELQPEDTDLLEQIVLKYGSKTQNHLIFLTHSELPWCEKRQGLKPYERSSSSLSLDTMYNYYRERHQRNVERKKNNNV